MVHKCFTAEELDNLLFYDIYLYDHSKWWQNHWGCFSVPPPPVPLALQSLVECRILSYLTCMLPYHIVRKHLFNQINPHGKNSGGDVG